MVDAHVDILLATHNGGSFVAHQIETILAQTHRNWRLLISDDGSSDGTLEVLSQLVRRDSRINLVSVAHRGSPAANFLSLLGYSDAEFSLFCDQDDHWEREKITRLVSALPPTGAAEPALIASDAYVTNEQMQVISDSFLQSQRIPADELGFGKILVQNPVLGCTAAFNRPLRDMVNFRQVNPSRVVMHDWWLALVASSFGTVRILPDRLIRYRQHGQNQIGAFKYSAKGLLVASTRGREKTARIVSQARYFRDLYRAELPERSRAVLDSFLAVFQAHPLERPYLLAKGGHLKTGVLRMIGQLAFAVDYKERNLNLAP